MRMLEAGDDPLFVLRRLIVFASEDVGNADPRALEVAVNADAAFRRAWACRRPLPDSPRLPLSRGVSQVELGRQGLLGRARADPGARRCRCRRNCATRSPG